MAEQLLAAIPALIILRGMMARVDGYGAFMTGAGQGVKTGVSLIPALTAMMMMLGLARASGLVDMLTDLIAPVLRLIHIPEETAALILLKPLSGSGSMAALADVFAQCGVDSRAGRIASVVAASSETIFYTMSVYLGATDVRRLPWALPVSLAAYGAGVAAAGLIL